MSLPETHCHLSHLPPIDERFILEAHSAVYQWPQQDFVPGEPVIGKSRIPGKTINRGIAIETHACTQHGQSVAGERHNSVSKTVYSTVDFNDTQFGKDIRANLGNFGARYLYNPPWSLYDWHQDIGGHECSINFLLSYNPGARTMHRFPMDCQLNYKVVLMEYELHKPVLMKSTIDHCIINLTGQDRYLLTIALMDAKYEEAKQWLLNYKLEGTYAGFV